MSFSTLVVVPQTCLSFISDSDRSNDKEWHKPDARERRRERQVLIPHLPFLKH